MGFRAIAGKALAIVTGFDSHTWLRRAGLRQDVPGGYLADAKSYTLRRSQRATIRVLLYSAYAAGILGAGCMIMRELGFISAETQLVALVILAPILSVLGISTLLGKHLDRPIAYIVRKEREQIPAGVRRRLDAAATEFEQQGYQLVGYAFVRHRARQWLALMMSPDKRQIVEIMYLNGTTITGVMGVFTDGLLVYCGCGALFEFSMHPRQTGVPILAFMWRERNFQELLGDFEMITTELAEQERLPMIVQQQDLFHFLHYEMLLHNWRTFHQSEVEAAYEALPVETELCRFFEGDFYFSFARNPELDNAFDQLITPYPWPARESTAGRQTAFNLPDPTLALLN